MSIPRDSLVAGPRARHHEDQRRLRDRRPEAAGADHRGQNTGIRVDDYIEIGFAGFVDVVDAVGGVQICPKRGDEGQEGRPRHQEGLPGGRRPGGARLRPLPATPADSATSAARSTSARWSARSARRPRRRGRCSTRCATSGSRRPAPSSLRVGEDTGMISTMRFAWAMTRVNGDERAHLRRPDRRPGGALGRGAVQAAVRADHRGPHRRRAQGPVPAERAARRLTSADRRPFGLALAWRCAPSSGSDPIPDTRVPARTDRRCRLIRAQVQ